MTTLRAYQQKSLDDLHDWWQRNPGATSAPVVDLPTGSGKSVVIAELVRLLFDTWPEDHPRTVVVVPSKELAEQNGAKLRAILPARLSVGYYSASIGRKDCDADVIVATIGSIYKVAHTLGNIRCVVIDEAHLVNQTSSEAGRYRQFLTDLSKYCKYRVVGYTATPFRGDGTWLTEGDNPLFTGVAHKTTMRELLEHEPPYLSPLVRPMDIIRTQIDTSAVSKTGGDYNMGELSETIEQYLSAAAGECVQLAHDRLKWIAFCATIVNAHHFKTILCDLGITAEVATGDTDKADRKRYIAEFRAGEIRCLITVLALATGFDVPDVDCLIWLRPTISPVLYVQGFGRGTRIAPGKADCLVLDFTDTVQRLGPVDEIKGRAKKRSAKEKGEAPMKVCPNCGERAPIGATECPTCQTPYPPPELPEIREPSNAAILSTQVTKSKIVVYPVTSAEYTVHRKLGKPDSMRVDYFDGCMIVGSEWVCLEHEGFAGAKARAWWSKRNNAGLPLPTSSQHAVTMLQTNRLLEPTEITVDETGKFHQIISSRLVTAN